MKKLIAFILAACMILALVGCGQTSSEPTPTEPAPTDPVVETQPVVETPQSFLWDNFDDRDPNAKPDTAPNGASIWWDNWANLRAKNEDGAIKLDMRPRSITPKITKPKMNTTLQLLTGCPTGAKPLICGPWTASPGAST